MDHGVLLFPARRFLVAAGSALLVAACGGGGGGGGAGFGVAAGPGEVPSPIPADAATKGAWSSLADWPIIPIHVVLLPDGRVLNFGTDDVSRDPGNVGNPDPLANPTTSYDYDVWTPAMGFGEASHVPLLNNTGTPGQDSVDFFCSAQLVLPEPLNTDQPSVLIVGGDTYPRTEVNGELVNDGNEKSLLFTDDTLAVGDDMSRGRWYATVTTLPNGETYVQGGTSKTRASGVDFPEVRSTDGIFRRLSGARTGDPDSDPATDPEGNGAGSLRYYYPRNFVAPSGLIFGFDTNGKMYYVDPLAGAGAGSLTAMSQFRGALQGDDSTAVMFRPGRILQVGGNNEVGSRDAEASLLIDINGAGSKPTPVLTEIDPPSSLRRLGTGTLLPDGQVLVTGGSEVYNELLGVNNSAEIWDPVTRAWALGAEALKPRLYHSTALLMPDGSVLVAGGGGPGAIQTNGKELNNFNAEVYFPPYLFAPATPPATPTLAARPTITAISADPRVGRSFTLDFGNAPGGIARVTLIKSGSVTHNFNMEQRFIELSFTATSASRLTVRMPSGRAPVRVGERPASDTPPGYYLLFVLDTNGVPSVAKSVFVNLAIDLDPAQDPGISNPGPRTNSAGAPIAGFSVAASDPAAQTLTFAAAGLPPGIAINTSTGALSGTPTTAGRYDSVVSVRDPDSRTATANFVWTVSP